MDSTEPPSNHDHGDASRAMLISGLISIVSCLAVMFTYYKKPHLWDSKHNRLIFYITVSDFLSALGFTFGYTKDESALCQAQVLLTNAPPLWSIFWTVVVAYNVVELLRRPLLRSVEAVSTEHVSWKVHAVIWTFPVLVTFGILTTNRFGCPSDQDVCWCYIGERPDTPYWGTMFWTILSFYLWEWLALIMFTCLFCYAMYKFRSDRSADAKVRRLLVQKLIGYPVIIIVCWLSATYADMTAMINGGNGDDIPVRGAYIVLICMPGLQGACIALLFFATKVHRTSDTPTPKCGSKDPIYLYMMFRRSLELCGVIAKCDIHADKMNASSESYVLEMKAASTLRDVPHTTGPNDLKRTNPNAIVAACGQKSIDSSGNKASSTGKADAGSSYRCHDAGSSSHLTETGAVQMLIVIPPPRTIPESVWAALASVSGLGYGKESSDGSSGDVSQDLYVDRTMDNQSQQDIAV